MTLHCVDFLFQTGIWDASTVDDIRSKFVDPLRKMVVVARAHSRQELEAKTKEEKRGWGQQGADTDEGPELSVEVMGSALPKLSPQDELKVCCYTYPQSVYAPLHGTWCALFRLVFCIIKFDCTCHNSARLKVQLRQNV